MDFWLGAKGGGVGGWCCIRLWSEKPSNGSEVVSREDVNKHQIWQGMSLESQSQGFLNDNSSLYNLRSSLGSWAEGFCVFSRLRNFVSANDEGTGLEHLMVRTYPRLSTATFHQGQEPLLKIWKLMLWESSFHLFMYCVLKFVFPWMDMSLWGICTRRNYSLFYMTILFQYRHLKTGHVPWVCSNLCMPSFFIFNGAWFPGLLLLWSVSLRHTIGGKAFLQWAVGLNTMLQAFTWSVQSQYKPKHPDTKMPSFQMRTSFCPLFSCKLPSVWGAH